MVPRVSGRLRVRCAGCALLLVGCGQNPGAPPDACASVGDDGAVTTAQGVVAGVAAGPSCAFLGIPYAEPPIGELRWRAPRPPATHAPVVAHAFGPPCSQIDLQGNIDGSEDCLRLNVWTPASPQGTLPVFVFLHGGGNVFGESDDPTYDGVELAARGGLVVVTFDYRLGVLGYLAHPLLSRETTPSSSGNYGVLDAIAAIGWVKANVASFGGDPAKITVFGQSAGSRTVCAILASPLARGLVQRAWMQSGTCDYPTLAIQENYGRAFAESLGCAGGDAAACLRKAPRDELIAASPGYPTLLDGSPYNPNIDGVLLRENPLVTLQSDADDVAIVVGSNSGELAQALLDAPLPEPYDASVEALFGSLAPSILARYPLFKDSPRAALLRILDDARYTCPMNRAAGALTGRAAPVYRALFSRAWPVGNGAAPAAFHGLELRFLFRTFDRLGTPASDLDLRLSDDFIAYVASLARSGHPRAPGGTEWPLFAPDTRDYIDLDVPPSAATGLGEMCAFWDSL